MVKEVFLYVRIGKIEIYYPRWRNLPGILFSKGAKNTFENTIKGAKNYCTNLKIGTNYPAKKFGVLKKYLDKYGLKGGIVCNDATTDELCICMEHYSDDINSDDWKVLEGILP